MSTKYPKEDWQYEVANGDTVLGYAEWVEHRKESNHERSFIKVRASRTNDELAKDILRSLNRMLQLCPDAVVSVLREYSHSVGPEVYKDPHMPMPDRHSVTAYSVLNGMIHELTGRFVMLKYEDGEPKKFRLYPKKAKIK